MWVLIMICDGVVNFVVVFVIVMFELVSGFSRLVMLRLFFRLCVIVDL